MQRHQRYPGLFAVAVRIANQRRVIQKLMQGLPTFLCILRRVRKFLQVFNPRERLRGSLLLQRPDITTPIIQKLNQLWKRCRIPWLAEWWFFLFHSDLGGSLRGCGSRPFQHDWSKWIEARRIDPVQRIGVSGVLCRDREDFPLRPKVKPK